MSSLATRLVRTSKCNPDEKLLGLALAEWSDGDGYLHNLHGSMWEAMGPQTKMSDDRMFAAFEGLIRKGIIENKLFSTRFAIPISVKGPAPSFVCEIQSRRPRQARSKRTFIYLMRNRRNGFTKIGESNNPKIREATLQSEEPEIELINQWVGSLRMEEFLHEEFSAKRVRGEWFNLDEKDIQDIAWLMTSGKEGAPRRRPF